MSQADRIPRSEWERNKEHIRALYLDENKSLNELINSMIQNHGFHASRAQYIRKLGTWDMKKYSTQPDWKRADALVRKRKSNGKDTEILVNGKPVPTKKLNKELRRYAGQGAPARYSFVEDASKRVVARTPPFSPTIPKTLDGDSVKLRRPSLTVGDKDHDHREQVHDESERPQLASGNSLLSMNRQTEHGYKRPTLIAPLDKKSLAPLILNLH